MASSKQLKVTEAEYVAVINEWWRQYTDDPDAFGHTAQVVKEMLEAQLAGTEPTIGQSNLTFFKHLLEQIRKPPLTASKPKRKAEKPPGKSSGKGKR
jgi:hypothetical protein